MIRLKDVEMEYDNGTRAIKGITLTIEDGEFVFLVGPSGSGKSTIIKLLTGEVEPCAGRIMINGFSVSNISEKQIPLMRRTLGVIFQDFRLIEKKTVYDNLAFVMRAVGASPKEIRKRIPYVLELVGLGKKADSYPTELSGGEQQRVAIARALVNNPNTIIADEPTGNLDPEILEDRYAIKLVDLEAQSETVEAVQALTGISDVSHYEEIAGGFVTVRNVATVVCVALIAILFVVSVFIISNTIKLTTFDRREEIAIMRMVGATNGFIRWPFVYEGFMLGLLGAVIAFFLQWALYAAVARGVDSNDTLQLIQVMPFSELWAPVAAVFALAGIVIGVGGSLSAIRKFLQV